MEYVSAGESHGPALTAIVTGVPAGLSISEKNINSDLARRQGGYGRGGRQKIEKDRVQVLSGVRFGKTLGSPVCLSIKNDDWENWTDRMAVFGDAPADLVREVTPRPGHADLLGVLKNDQTDCRNILERSSARETAIRVAASGIAREFLAEVGVEVYSYVVSIGGVGMIEEDPMRDAADYRPLAIEMSELRCPDEEATEAMKARIDEAKELGQSLGGTFRVVVNGLLPALGGFEEARNRLTSKLGGALFSIPAIKGVEFGIGFKNAEVLGHEAHDEIYLDKKKGFMRRTNRAGGLEGGMTTGMPLIMTAAMKPIPTQIDPLNTVNIDTLEVNKASTERSDVCAVPAASVVAEAEVAFVIAQAYLDKFGSDNMTDIKANIESFKKRIKTMSR
ncbi:chorismate synthase [Eggerthella sp. CAG:298]|nr:chorismate synthase [Eggerthella sp. CAG:298]